MGERILSDEAMPPEIKITDEMIEVAARAIRARFAHYDLDSRALSEAIAEAALRAALLDEN